ncbi:MAG: aminotransferase class I/II-fold pyridoxal phosphate-dependent enzyme [Vicinamibacteria bacterium]|nr:aminotransferase class I/II-fold pyridoxal phosphate-dependent enzyme [Vicinamibacteria bacterium]
MRALILAAGLGRRLGDLTRDRTKAMVEVAGHRLIDRALDALLAAGIHDVVIVLGHGAPGLRAAIEGRGGDLCVVFIENPVYAETNNIYSLWLAREVLAEGDTLVLESDLIFDPGLIVDVLNDDSKSLAVVAPFKPWMDGTVTILDPSDDIVSLLPRAAFEWRDASRYFKTVNIYKFSRGFSRDLYLPFLEAYIRAFGRSRFYEQVLSVITAMGKSELQAHRTTRLWYEIDDVEDLRTAETLFSAPQDRLLSYARRFGGFWRFPGLLDACYLVHPFFPPPRLLEEMKAQFDGMVTAYPSGMDVQCELATRLFPVRPSQLLVGNGASELIRSLRRVLPGPWCVPVPTFEEYLAHGESNVVIDTSGAGFTPDPSQLETLAGGARVLALANPNNPTGRLLTAPEVAAQVEVTRRLGMRLILDESFIDFAVDADTLSLLSAELLDQNPHVIVLRSLGKSHGVGGLRLGVVATGDKDLLANVRADLPIWNVGSLAEGFLQVAPRHHEAYRDACRRLAAERTRLSAALDLLPGVRVFPSHANFLLVALPVMATPVVNRLLEGFEILIKDLTGKAGLGGGRFVRIAVRTEQENDRLLVALETLLAQERA